MKTFLIKIVKTNKPQTQNNDIMYEPDKKETYTRKDSYQKRQYLQFSDCTLFLECSYNFKKYLFVYLNIKGKIHEDTKTKSTD